MGHNTFELADVAAIVFAFKCCTVS